MAWQATVDGPVSHAGHGQVRALPVEVEFRVCVVHDHGDVCIRPVGDVDLASIGQLRDRTNEALAAGADRVILDLRATTFLDSTGLHLVIEIDRWATRTGSEFVIIAGPPAVQTAFDAAGLTARLPFVDGPQHLERTGFREHAEGGPRHEDTVRPRA
jgi:anti-anti-sigma factor